MKFSGRLRASLIKIRENSVNILFKQISSDKTGSQNIFKVNQSVDGGLPRKSRKSLIN